VQNKAVLNKTISGINGENVFDFESPDIIKGKQYTITMTTPDGNNYSLLTRLR
jgi:hypothetical protein